MDCILFTASPGDRGYSRVRHKGKMVYRHRLVMAQHLGVELEALAGQHVLHSCDVRNCANPEHLRLGTNAENMQDKAERNMSACLEQHHSAKLTIEQVLWARAVYIPRHLEYGAAALARRFGVATAAMHNAIRGKTWRKINASKCQFQDGT